VESLVAEVYASTKGICFLEVENANANAVFSGLAFSPSAKQFDDLAAHRGKWVQITGHFAVDRHRSQVTASRRRTAARPRQDRTLLRP